MTMDGPLTGFDEIHCFFYEKRVTLLLEQVECEKRQNFTCMLTKHYKLEAAALCMIFFYAHVVIPSYGSSKIVLFLFRRSTPGASKQASLSVR